MSADKPDYVQMWLNKANNDLQNAQIKLGSKSEPLPLDTVCFHCQQAAEKYIKAFLIYKEKVFPFTHNLADLIAVCMQVDLAFAEIQRKAEKLTPFAVEIRYPDDFYMPTKQESDEAFAIAAEIKSFIFSRLDVHYQDFSN